VNCLQFLLQLQNSSLFLFSRLYNVPTSSCACMAIIVSSSSSCFCNSRRLPSIPFPPSVRGELSYLVSLGSENISAPYFKQCFFREGGITPQTESNTTPPNPKTEITNILFYILNLWRRTYCPGLRGCDTREKEIVI
jgi:hypothetical protein